MKCAFCSREFEPSEGAKKILKAAYLPARCFGKTALVMSLWLRAKCCSDDCYKGYTSSLFDRARSPYCLETQDNIDDKQLCYDKEKKDGERISENRKCIQI